MKKNIRIGDILVEEQLITNEQLEQALLKQKESNGKKIGDILVDLGFVTEIQFMQALSKRLKIPFVNLRNYPVADEILNLIDEQIAKKYQLVPIAKHERTITIATCDPMNLFAVEEVKLATKLEVNTVISTKSDIASIIKRYYSGQKALSAAGQLEKQYSHRENIVLQNTLQMSELENAPIVKMINSILLQGVQLKASDIHIEAEEECTRVRMRVDGKLHEQMHLHISSHEAIVTRLKIMSNMDIAEKRVPQDGRFEVTLEGKHVEVRVSSMPTINGEKVVIRILNTEDEVIKGKSELGFRGEDLIKFEKMIKAPYGIVLVTGPTGSGKSTTLYSILSEISTPEDNIITLEDPVEKKIKGINQVHINTKAGLTFASGLRAILRQDPNIIMVGEIRDAETASITIRAGITGHLVFSTLHTNDSISTVTRLIDMGIEPYLVSSAVVGIIAQRLVRTNCPHCQVGHESTVEENKILEIDKSIMLYKGSGCQQCHFTGYKGRMAVHEVLLIDRYIRQMISKGSGLDEIKEYCKVQGMSMLKDNMIKIVLEGKSTIEELIKITYSLD